jgi:hypothetical protein
MDSEAHSSKTEPDLLSSMSTVVEISSVWWRARARGWTVVVAMVLLLTTVRAEPAPTLHDLLQRAGVYVADFHRQLSGIVADEEYEQSWNVKAGGNRPPKPHQRRVLSSDLVLVKPVRDSPWMEFRDVYQVDGSPVRDRADRLTKLFLEPSASGAAQIGHILDDSSRYNIGDIERNINTPIFALLFLELANQDHFTFKLTKDRTPVNATASGEHDAAFRVSTEVWVISYDERHAGTLIRTINHRDLPAHGRFWVDAAGRVLMSELAANTRRVRATIDVSYQSEPLLGFLVPIEMREHYEGRTGSVIEGRASYGKFRQFQVSTDETFLLKK